MANMALNIEQRIGQKLTIEQTILWNKVISITGNNLTVTPIHENISFAGSEFSIFAANKLYVAHNMILSGASGATSGFAYVGWHNNLDVLTGYWSNSSLLWNVTAAEAQIQPNNINIQNVFFGRLIASRYPYIVFTGYRVNY